MPDGRVSAVGAALAVKVLRAGGGPRRRDESDVRWRGAENPTCLSRLFFFAPPNKRLDFFDTGRRFL